MGDNTHGKTKQFVQEKMAEVAAAKELTLSEKRAAAGRLGAEARNQTKEKNRRADGRKFQNQFDMQKNEVRAELANYADKPGIDPNELFTYCCYILEDVAWQREYPTSDEVIDEEYQRYRNPNGTLSADESVIQEEQKYHSFWINAGASQIVGGFVHLDVSKLPPFKNLLVKALNQFVELVGKDDRVRQEQTKHFPRLLLDIKDALQKIQDGTSYIGPWIPAKYKEPTVKRPKYDVGSAPTGLTQATLRAAAERQEQQEQLAAEQRERDRILREAREKEAEQLHRQLSSDAWNYLHPSN